MTYLSESATWSRRRKRRQRAVLAIVLLLVLGIGAVAAGLYLGYIKAPAGEVQVTTPGPCVTPKPATPALDARRVKVNVYNATSRAGLAASTAAALRKRRFVVGEVANDPVKAQVTGTALVRYGPKGSAAAKLVAAQVPGAKLVADKRAGAVVDLVVGRTYKGLGPVARPSPASTAKPTATSTPTCAPTKTGAPKTRPTTTPR